MTFEHITLRHRRIAGIHGTGSPFMSLRGVVSYNAVPAFGIEGNDAIVTILYSRFIHTGAGEAPAAIGIPSRSYLTLKNISAEGYPVLVAEPRSREPAWTNGPGTSTASPRSRCAAPRRRRRRRP